MWAVKIKQDGEEIGWLPKYPPLKSERNDGGLTVFPHRRAEYTTIVRAMVSRNSLRILYEENGMELVVVDLITNEESKHYK